MLTKVEQSLLVITNDETQAALLRAFLESLKLDYVIFVIFSNQLEIIFDNILQAIQEKAFTTVIFDLNPLPFYSKFIKSLSDQVSSNISNGVLVLSSTNVTTDTVTGVVLTKPINLSSLKEALITNLAVVDIDC